MTKSSLFTNEEASDPAYINVRAAENEITRKAKQQCEVLWDQYEEYADNEFRVELRNNFDARYWEMYLTVSLIDMGFSVTCPKPDPDVGIQYKGQRIWFEATSLTRGLDGTADQVPERISAKAGEEPVVYQVPNELLILRYLNGISEKYMRQLPRWLKNGAVTDEDALVIAINPRSLGFEHADTLPPRILQTAFNLGAPYATFDRQSLAIVETGYQFRNQILKASGNAVSSGIFHLEEYCQLSGLLCSRIDVVNQPRSLGADYQLVPNPNAANPLPANFRIRGTYFRVDQIEDQYKVIPEQC